MKSATSVLVIALRQIVSVTVVLLFTATVFTTVAAAV